MSNAKQQLEELILAFDGDPKRVTLDNHGNYQYYQRFGDMEVRITNHDQFMVPWVDLYRFGAGNLGPILLMKSHDPEFTVNTIREFIVKEAQSGN